MSCFSAPNLANMGNVLDCYFKHRLVKVFFAVAVVGVGCRVIAKTRTYLKKKKRIERSLQKKDVVILHQFPRGYLAPSVSPFPLKLETYLRMSNIPYENDFSDFMGPKQKCPYITLNGEDIADSQLIIEHLNIKYGINLNEGISETNEALGHVLRIVAESSLYWSMVMDRWIYDRARTVTKVSSNFSYPAYLFIRYLIWRQAWCQGIARHRKKEIIAMAKKDLHALSKLLGNKKYFLGDKPHEADCALFGSLAQLVWNFPNSYFETMLNGEYENLKNYCLRMKEEFWPDWDSCLKQR